MTALIIGCGYKNSFLAKHAPFFSLRKVAATAPITGTRTLHVQKEGVMVGGEKLPWSRLAAWQLEKLGISEIRFDRGDNPGDVLDLAVSIQHLTDSTVLNGIYRVINPYTTEGKKALINSPLVTEADLLMIVNDRYGPTDKSTALAALHKLKAMGKLNKFDYLHSPNALITVQPLVEPEQKDNYLTQLLQTLARLNYFGESLVTIINQLAPGSGREEEIQNVIIGYRQRESALQDYLEANNGRDDDFGGTPSHIAGIPGRY